MVSDSEKQPSAATRPKRRRLQGACDICKKQKARCDSAEMPGNRCSNCIAFQSECTHSAKSKGSSRTNATNVLNPLRTAPDHITFILSGSKEYISGDPSTIYQILLAVAQYARRLEEALATTTGPSPSINTESHIATEKSDDTDTDSDNDGVILDSNLAEPLRQITRDISLNRFYGKSSSINFVKAVMDVKTEAIGDIGRKPLAQRPEFWDVRPWEITTDIFVPQLFPEPELMQTLLENFLEQVNTLVYVVHAPTFRNAVAAGLHLHNQQFGAVVLTACALGSKFSEDPRIFLEGTDEHSAGWRWYRQVRPIPTSFLVSPSLYQLQLICLSMLYLASGSCPEECWTVVGVGVRMAYDVGAHHRIRSRSGDKLEAELYKRAFWMLLCSDTIMSALMGRPRSTAIDDLDIELPVPLEGEEPIVAIYGPLLRKLMEIWARVQDAIYAVKQKEQAYQEVVAELDSALNQWVDSIPEELRWDPNRQNLIRLNQSACIYATYYHVQILLHRPFIPSRGSHSSLSSISFPSLAICANAGRSCAHVMEVQATRGAGPLYNPQIIAALFDSAVILLLNVFHRSRPSTDQSVQKCLNVLRIYERRWQIAGRNADILAGILEGHAQVSSMLPSLKRTRSSEHASSSESPVPDAFEEPRNIAGSKRVAAVTQEIEQLQVSDQEIERLLFLPLHTEDLGRLPLYESFDFDSIFHSNVFSTDDVAGVNQLAPLDPPPLNFDGPFEANWDEWRT